MKTCNGGAKVRSGYYWNLRAWEVVTVSGARHGAGFEGAESTLPGGQDDRFVHVPLPVLFVVAPVMGGLFAIFLPFIGFAMTFYGAGKKVAQLVGRRSAKLAQS